MPAAPRHRTLDCPGTLVRAYERAGTGFKPFGYVCNSCGHFARDEEEMPVSSVAELRPAMESAARELMNLLWDRRVYKRFEGIVQGNSELLASAQAGNPFVNSVRRWWAVSAALVLRRHVDAGSGGTLRWVLEQLVKMEQKYSATSKTGTSTAEADLRTLEEISFRFRPFLNELIYGSRVPGTSITVTYNDLLLAIDTVQKVAERTYGVVLQVSMQLEPIEQFEWTDIFQYSWLPKNTQFAYDLGSQGVPFDALPLTLKQAEKCALLTLSLDNSPTNLLRITVSNEKDVDALDVRVFIPHLRTPFDVPEIKGLSSASVQVQWNDNGDPRFGHGQAVLEFNDVYGQVYRQYADVDVRNGRVRNLSPIAYLVKAPIVTSQYAYS